MKPQVRSSLADYKEYLGEWWQEYKRYYREALSSGVPLLDRILDFILRNPGKELRPLFLLLSGRVFGELNERVVRAAVLVEMLHNATLVHDDVVDGGVRRRGWFSVPFLWGERVAVLVGDFLLARGLLYSLKHRDFDTLELLSRAVKQMSESELLQMEKARTMDVSRSLYFRVIEGKTASLFGVCASLGARLQGVSADVVEKMYEFGLKVGMAFQIRDDILDLVGENTGKGMFNDLKNRKYTLPVIIAAEKLPLHRRFTFFRELRRVADSRRSAQTIRHIIDGTGAIQEAESYLERLVAEAYTILDRLECEGIIAERKAAEKLKGLVRLLVFRSA